MFLIALIFLIVVLVFVYPYLQDRREADLAKRLEKLRESGAAASAVDAAIAASQRDADFLKQFHRHR